VRCDVNSGHQIKAIALNGIVQFVEKDLLKSGMSEFFPLPTAVINTASAQAGGTFMSFQTEPRLMFPAEKQGSSFYLPVICYRNVYNP